MAHRSRVGGATYHHSRSLDGGRHEHPRQEYQDRPSVAPVVVEPRQAGPRQLVAPRPLAQRADESQRPMPQRYRRRAAQFRAQSVQAILDGLTWARRRRRRIQAAMASSRRPVTAGPKPPMTMNTTTMAPAMKVNTPMVP